MTTLASMPYPTARDAAKAAREEPALCAVRLDGMNLVMDRESADGLDAQGVTFAFLHWCEYAGRAGRIVTVPVN
jgi:hypothetical protein